MDNLHLEIVKYLEASKLTEGTKTRNKKFLFDFNNFLATRTNSQSVEVHVEKIYGLRDTTGAIIGYLPLKPQLIDEYFISNVEKGYWFLYNSRSALSSFFKYLYRRYDFFNVMNEMTFKVEDFKRIVRPRRILSRHEVLKFLQSLIKYSRNLKRDLLLFTILLHTGCRISEVLELRVCDINFSNEVIFLEHTKNKRQRNAHSSYRLRYDLTNILRSEQASNDGLCIRT